MLLTAGAECRPRSQGRILVVAENVSGMCGVAAFVAARNARSAHSRWDKISVRFRHELQRSTPVLSRASSIRRTFSVCFILGFWLAGKTAGRGRQQF